MSCGHVEVVASSKRKAAHYLRIGNYGRAVAHSLVVLTLNKEEGLDMMPDLIVALENWAQELSKSSNVLSEATVERRAMKVLQSVETPFRQALSAFHYHDDMRTSYAVTLLHLGLYDDAWSQFLKVLRKNPDHKRAVGGWRSACCKVIPRWHFFMVNDMIRNAGYQAALKETIKLYGPGKASVLDIGTGSGILSMMAVKGGARRVFACEMSKIMVSVASVAIDSFLEKCPGAPKDAIRLIPKMSTRVNIPADIPQRAQICVTETFDAALLGEEAVRSVKDAWANLLKPPDPRLCGKDERETDNAYFGSCLCEGTGRETKHWAALTELDPTKSVVIPFRVCLFAAIVESEDIAMQVKPSSAVRKKLPPDVNVTWEHSEGYYDCERLGWLPRGVKYLTKPVRLITLNFMERGCLERWVNHVEPAYILMDVIADGRPDCVVTWFNLHLTPTLAISSHPSANTCWEQAVYPANLTSDRRLVSGSNVVLRVEQSAESEAFRGLKFGIDVDEAAHEDRMINSPATHRVPFPQRHAALDSDDIRMLNTEGFYPLHVGGVVLQLGGHVDLVAIRFPGSEVHAIALPTTKPCMSNVTTHQNIELYLASDTRPTSVVLFPVDETGLLDISVVNDWIKVRGNLSCPVFPRGLSLEVRLVRSRILSKLWDVDTSVVETEDVDGDVMDCVARAMKRVAVPYHLKILPGGIPDVFPCSEGKVVFVMDFSCPSLAFPLEKTQRFDLTGSLPNAVLARWSWLDTASVYYEVAFKLDVRNAGGEFSSNLNLRSTVKADGMLDFDFALA